MASPYKFRLRQPNGTMTPYLLARGGPGYHYMTDMEGYMVTENANNSVVYAMVDEISGEIVPSQMMVGSTNPGNQGVPNESSLRDTESRRLYEPKLLPASFDTISSLSSRRLSIPTNLINLVILIRFSDHKTRHLPPIEDVDILFNKVGGDPIIAPTGSIRDVFTTNSYGKFTLRSEVFGWVDLSESEAYYAHGTSGFGTDRYFDALHEALNTLETEMDLTFDRFDADGDGEVDMVTLLHSGYAAEIPGADMAGATSKDRIWSHRWSLPKSRFWTSTSKRLQVRQYATAPALWSKSGDEIGRIGVIAHEIGHCLDLPDLYGLGSGNGIGSYDLMSNHWGFGPYALRQFYPPTMSPWTKMKAGWLIPNHIVMPGRYSLDPSVTNDTVYRIDIGILGNEYLIIENRQPIDYDIYLPNPGLAIWHIDEMAEDVSGYPGQPGWPDNGKHYRVALLQADGRYDLERGLSQGDAGDLFHADGINALIPSDTVFDGPFPNTDAYQNGSLYKTGIEIFEISKSGTRMDFSVRFEPQLSTLAGAQSLSTKEIKTTFAGGNGSTGNMFDIQTIHGITVHALDLHVIDVGSIVVEVWTKSGSFIGADKDQSAWSRHVEATINGNGRGKKTFLDIGELRIEAGELYSFYVTATGQGLRYTNGIGIGNIVASNNDLIVYEGIGKETTFGHTFNDRIWNGALYYSVENYGLTTVAPTSQPTNLLLPHSRTLETTFTGTTGQSGIMFDVFAYADISINGFDINMADSVAVQVDVFTKKGTLVGYERDCSAWSVITSIIVAGEGFGNPTYLNLEGLPVSVAKDSMQSFYITLRSGAGVRYSVGEQTGNIYASDKYLAVLAGVGKSYPCGLTFRNRVWNGAVHYSVNNGGMSPGKPDDIYAELEVTFFGEEFSSSNLFSLQSKKALSLIGLGVHINSTAWVNIELYSAPGGLEKLAMFGSSQETWRNVASVKLLGQGDEHQTHVPSDAFRQVKLLEREDLTFFIKVAVDGESSTGEVFGLVVPTSNTDLEVSYAYQPQYEIFTSSKLQKWKAVTKYHVE